MVTKKRRMSLPNQRTSDQGSVKTTCLSLLRSTFSISVFRPAKADFGTPPFEALRQNRGFYQCSAPCRRRRPNHGHSFTSQRDESGGAGFRSKARGRRLRCEDASRPNSFATCPLNVPSPGAAEAI